MPRRRNRYVSNSLSDLNSQREIQENRGRHEYFNNNREARRYEGDRGRRIGNNPVDDSSGINRLDLSSFEREYISQWITSNPQRSQSLYVDFDKPENKYIKPYNYKPEEFIFSKTNEDVDDKSLYIGTEIEIDCAGEIDDNAKYVIDNLKECYTVHDGSLNNGFEIVTHPATLGYHKQMNYSEVFQWLLDKGYRSHDTRTCGLHVHVNRDYLSENKTIQDLCITKILFLLEKYWNEITKIARRSECNYSVKIKRDSDDDSLLDLLYKAKGSSGYFSNAKYNCLNLLHKNTIEFRIFKGTLKYETYIATLEFVKNIVDISKRVPLEEIQLVTFEGIINANETEYLMSYLEERNIK